MSSAIRAAQTLKMCFSASTPWLMLASRIQIDLV
jgi:hypothetical protein